MCTYIAVASTPALRLRSLVFFFFAVQLNCRKRKKKKIWKGEKKGTEYENSRCVEKCDAHAMP